MEFLGCHCRIPAVDGSAGGLYFGRSVPDEVDMLGCLQGLYPSEQKYSESCLRDIDVGFGNPSCQNRCSILRFQFRAAYQLRSNPRAPHEMRSANTILIREARLGTAWRNESQLPTKVFSMHTHPGQLPS